MMDEESVHALSLEDDVGCVVAVEARELLSESGRVAEQDKQVVARHSPIVPGCFNNSSEDAGKVSFYYIPRSYRSPMILICHLFAFSCHANDYGHFSFVHTNFFLVSIACFFPTCDTNTNITWSILERAGSYLNTSKRCNVCLAEVFHSRFADKHPSLNERTEMVSACRHHRKFLVPLAVT